MDKKLSEELEEKFTMKTKRATFISIDEMELIKKADHLEKQLANAKEIEDMVIKLTSRCVKAESELQSLEKQLKEAKGMLETSIGQNMDKESELQKLREKYNDLLNYFASKKPNQTNG